MLTIKSLLLRDKNWYYYRKYFEEHNAIRPAVIHSITKILSCKHYTRGYAEYHCSDSSCTHIKRVKFSCKDRSCSVCGRTATDKWIAKQKNTLPPCQWQHVTFTIPADLGPFFQTDRRLINELPKLAAHALKKIAKKKDVMPGMFMAIHTFGRKLNWNVHLHVSVTRGGLTKNNEWRTLFFKSKTLMAMWRYAVITLIRQRMVHGLLSVPGELHGKNIFQLLEKQYDKYWRVHCAKPHKNPKKDIEYLGRYITRPAISNARLLHYDGANVIFDYLDHRTKKNNMIQMEVFDFFDRFTQHIPERYFRMIRYFGFLSNRLRGKLLPIVNRLFNHKPKEDVKYPWQFLVKQKLGLNPLECILCRSQMRLGALSFGLSFRELNLQHDQLALQKQIRIYPI